MPYGIPTFFAIPILMWCTAGYAQYPLGASATAATDAPVATPSLDAISVRPNKSGAGMMRLRYTPDGFMVINGTVHMLLTAAYDANQDQLIGEPGWAKTDRFDIEAKVTGPEAATVAKLTAEQRRAMLQQLLAERFKVTAHRETRELPVYTLKVAKGGAKLKQSQSGAEVKKGTMMAGKNSIDAQDAPLSLLASVLSNQLGRTVIDKTALTGTYEFRMRWTPDDAPPPLINGSPDPNPPPGIFTAIEEQLGLKLNAAKGPVDVIVVDHLEKPEEN